MPPAVIGGVVAAAGALGAAAISKSSGPSGPPDINNQRKKTLGSFAERLAAEEADFQNARDKNSILLRPGGTPIFNNNPMLRKPNEPLIFK